MARLFNDAASDNLVINSPVVTAHPFTMACWFTVDDLTVDTDLIWAGDKDVVRTYTSLRFLGSTGSDKLGAWSINPSASQLAQTTSACLVNTWYHVCGIFAADDSRVIFLDGGSKGSATGTVAPSGYDRTAVGYSADSTPTRYHSGMIAESVIWNIALTDADVALLAKGVSPFMVHPESIVAYWPLIGRISPEIDIVGGFNLTVTGAVVANHPRIIYSFSPMILGIPAAVTAELAGRRSIFHSRIIRRGRQVA